MSVENLLKTKIDIVEYIGRYADLRPKGSLYEGKCPIHGSDEGTPLVIYPQTNSYYCFACESGGDIIQFVSDYEDISRTMAIKKLAHEANINIDADEDWRKAVKVEDTHRSIIDKVNWIKLLITYISVVLLIRLLLISNLALITIRW